MNKIFNFFKANWKDIFKPIIVLTSICIIIPLALALTNLVTVDKISKLAKENQIKAMESLASAEEFLSQTIAKDDGTDHEYNVALNGGNPSAYIFTLSSKGYGGDVSVMTAIDVSGKIIGVDILDASGETPGLGQNVTKEGFYSQFAEKNGKITVVKNGANASSNEINAVTGASISSRAVTNAVNEALELFEKISANGGAAE